MGRLGRYSSLSWNTKSRPPRVNPRAPNPAVHHARPENQPITRPFCSKPADQTGVGRRLVLVDKVHVYPRYSTHDPPNWADLGPNLLLLHTLLPTTMMHFTSVFVAVLAAVRFAGVISFTGLSVRPSSYRNHVSQSSWCRSGALGSATPADVSNAAAAAMMPMPTPRRTRWCSRLGASGETLGAEGEALSEESDAASVEAQSAGGTGAGVDLSKGIAFEAPKPKALEPEQEEESESKKVRSGCCRSEVLCDGQSTISCFCACR